MTRAVYEDEQVLARRRNRKTGLMIALVWNGGADPDQPWETICEEHGGVCSHETRKVAESFMAVPDEWCEACGNNGVWPTDPWMD